MTGEDFLKPEAFKPHLDQIRSENTGLPEPPLGDLSGSDAKLPVVRKWIHQGGISADNSKIIIEGLKAKLFDSLKPSHIDDKYYSFLQALEQKLR